MGEKLKKTRWHSCNVLQVGPEARQVWQFDARNGGFVLNREQTSMAGEPLPSRLIAKDWRTLWQQKLNVAWLPPEQVFLRVAQFPQSDFAETLSMVELQLEKLSPIPVAQIVWSINAVPQAGGNMQTVIITIVARSVVEEFLGQLEGQGYMADRLELPVLDQLQATPITEDGAWIYPDTSGGRNSALVAWWYGGVLQNLDLVGLHPPNPAVALKEQIMQMAWAGELEGWLTSPPRWHLVANEPTAQLWETALRQGLEQPVEVVAPLAPSELAALTARRAARSDSKATLLPAEFSTRYHQQFIDRLWMRGLLAVAAVYMAGVVIYVSALQVAAFKTRGVEAHVNQLSGTYTNAIQTKDLLKVLKDRQDLKYAALDCWKILAEQMPETVTLESWNFSDGKKLVLAGTAPADQTTELINFESAMRKASDSKGQPMFNRTKGDHLSYQIDRPGSVRWSFGLELNRAELP